MRRTGNFGNPAGGLAWPQWLALTMLVTWLVLPLLPLTLWSVSRSWYYPDILPSAYSLRAWRYVFSEASGVLPALGTAAVIATGCTLLATLIGFPAGRALGLYRFRGKALIELLVLTPIVVPGIAVAAGLHAALLKAGLAGTIAGVMIVHLIPTLPYMVLVMAGIFANYNPALEEQARSLGANALQTFWHITLPAVLPGLLTGALFAFLVSWSQYILTLMIGGGRVVTLPLLLYNFASAGRNDVAGALSLLFILPGLIFLVIVARRLTGRHRALPAMGQI